MPELPPGVADLPPKERPEVMFSVFFGPRRAEPMLADLLPLVEEWHPDLLVCDQAELAGPIAAAVAGVPNVTHGFGRLLSEQRVARAGDVMARLWSAQGLQPRPYAGTYDHLYVDPYPPSLQTRATAYVGEIQSIRPSSLRPGTPEALVYITFGTVFNRDLALFATAAEAARELPVEVVVTLGPGHDPAELEPQPDNVRVAEFIPQDELLPRCAAVVSHGGSGTFLGALAAGVPQLVIALMADQYLNADAGVEAGVAAALSPADASVDGVRAALRQVLDDDAMRTAARTVADEIAAMPSPDVVASELERRYG